MKVLMVSSDFSVKGGMTTVAKSYMENQDKIDVEYTFIPTHIDGNIFKKSWFFIKNYFRIRRIINQFEIIHIHVSERGSFKRKALVVKLAKKRNKKVIFHHHGPELLEDYQKQSSKNQKYTRDTLQLVDVNIALSEEMKSRLLRINPNSNVEVLYNGVLVPRHNPYNTNGKIILFLGKIGWRKGAFDLLKAIFELNNEIDSKYKFYFCGNGEVEELKKAVKELDLENRVPHVGWISVEARNKLFDNVVLNILPSYHEGMPMTILETMANGIPNISTAINSIPEIISSDAYGILVKSGDIDGIKFAIKKMLNDMDLRESISMNAHNLMVDKFAIDLVLNKLKTIYKKIIGEIL